MNNLPARIGVLYTVAAPSGAGKTSLVHELVATTKQVEVSVSHTTRARRPGEHDGADYHFVSAEQFQALITSEVFLEHAEVFGFQYGTSADAVRERLAQGKDVILEIDWQGARQVRELIETSVSIYILPPSLQELSQRLRDRGQDDNEVIERRMREAVSQMSHHDEFDFIIFNDHFGEALSALRSIVLAHRQRTAAQKLQHAAEIDALLS